jgi:hypothetical protein
MNIIEDVSFAAGYFVNPLEGESAPAGPRDSRGGPSRSNGLICGLACLADIVRSLLGLGLWDALGDGGRSITNGSSIAADAASLMKKTYGS